MAPESHRAWLLDALKGNSRPFPDGHDPITFAESIMDDAREEGVAALLHSALENANPRPKLPEELHTELKHHTQLAAAQELARAHEVQQVLTLFADHDIQYLLIKGTPLAYSIYPRPYLRTRSDTDIVFSDQRTALAAWQLIETRGYHRPNAITGDTISTQFSCYRELPASTSNTFDMHWRLNNSWRIADLLDFDELSSRAEPVSRLYRYARTPCTVDSLIIACLHRIAHRPELLHNRLIWLYDIHLIVERLKTSDRVDLANICLQKNISQAVLDGLEAANEAFETKLPQDLINTLESDEVPQAVKIHDYTTSWRRELSQLKALPTIRHRIAHLLNNLFPTPRYVMDKYDAKNTLWLPWLYARRISGGFAKRGKKRSTRDTEL